MSHADLSVGSALATPESYHSPKGEPIGVIKLITSCLSFMLDRATATRARHLWGSSTCWAGRNAKFGV